MAVDVAGAVSAGAAAQDRQSKLRDLLDGTQPGTPVFSLPKPRSKIFGSTEDIRWLAEVEAILEVTARKLPPPTGIRAGAKIALCFEVDAGGHSVNIRACGPTGHRSLEAFVRRVVDAVGPYPLPPASEANRGLMWVYAYDGSPSLRFK